MKKKLFIVVDVDWFFLSHRLPIALKAMESGYEVTVVSTDTGKAQQIREKGIRFVNQNFLRKSLNPIQEVKIIRRLYQVYKEHKPDIVHHVALKMIMNGSVAARLAGVKKVVNAVAGLGHYFVDPYKGILFSLLFSPFFWFARCIKSYHYIFQNEDDRAQFLRFKWVRLSKTTIIKGSGVDLSYFPFTELPSSEPIKVLCATRLLKDKGIYEFAECARIVKNQCAGKVDFILAGKVLPINPSAVSEEAIREWEGKGWIEWIGFQEDMVDLLKKTHIHVLPSYREGLPKSLIESCAIGRPIVTTDVPGCRDVVDNTVNGFLVPAKNPEALAKAILLLVDNFEMRKKMGQAARRKAESEFTIGLVVKETIRIYEKI